MKWNNLEKKKQQNKYYFWDIQYLDFWNILYLDLENILYFYQTQILTWLLFSLFKGIHKACFLLARQTRLDNTKFLLTQKIKNKVSTNKR